MRNWSIRLSIFALVLAVAQVLVASLFPAEIPPEITRLDAYLADGVDVIYFGDSTLTYPLGQVTTGEILQEMLPNATVGQIAHPAYSLDLYLHYVRYILGSPRGRLRPTRPDVIIVPINMRSFSPEWDMRPGYQFEEEKKTLALGPVLARILSRPLAIFGAFRSPITQATFLDTTVYNGDTPLGTVADFERLTEQDALGEHQRNTEFAYHDVLPSEEDAEAMAQALIYRYMTRLTPDHRQLQAMREIARLGDEAGVRVLFYVTPVNYQQGQRFVGDAFRAVLREKIGLVQSVLGDETHAALLNLGFDLEAFAFVDMEHLREAGKTYVAEQLALAVDSAGGMPTPSANGGTGTPTPLPPQAQAVTQAVTPAATPIPPPTTTVPVPAQTPTSTLRAPATPAPTASAPPQHTPIVDRTRTRIPSTVAPLNTIPVSPTPALSGVSPGSLIRAVFLWHYSPKGDADTNRYEVDVYRLRYRTVDEKGSVAEIQADLFVPSAGITATFPILVHAPGTTGLTDACAPLNEDPTVSNWGSYVDHSLTFAARGYIVVMPNGLGFDDPTRIHPYFIAKLQAHVLLDAARAVYNLAADPPADSALSQPAKAVFFMGYSSGGHAAFAARDWAASYAPELPVAGIIGYGPTTNGETLLRENPIFAPYIIYAYRDFYGSEIVDVADVFMPQWVPTFESDVLNMCVDGIFDHYTRSTREMYTPVFRMALESGRLDEAFPLLTARLAENDTGLKGGTDIPVLILQGTGDTVVTPDSQRAFKDQLCQQGATVTYVEYPAVSHPEIRTVSFGDTLWWMQRVAEGVVPETHCEAIDGSQ
ncbi:MAG: lipase family protein [Anaerolineae bacterium]|jgi:dienelactone hydrolase